MNKIVTREYTQENGYGSNDQYQLYYRCVNGKPEALKIGLKNDQLSTKAMKLLADDLHTLAGAIENDLGLHNKAATQERKDRLNG